MNVGAHCMTHQSRQTSREWPCPECVLDSWAHVVRAACYIESRLWKRACREAGVRQDCLEVVPRMGIIDQPDPERARDAERRAATKRAKRAAEKAAKAKAAKAKAVAK